MIKYKDLKEYLNNKFYDEIFTSCDEFLKYNIKDLYLFSNNIPNPFKSTLDDVKITSLYSERKSDNNIIIKAIVLLNIIIKGKINRRKYVDNEEELIYRYVEILISTDFEKTFKNFKVTKVNPIADKTKYDSLNSLSNSFVPYMEEKHLDDYANLFLKELYPNALKQATKLPVEDIANKLGLNVKYLNLEDDIFGKIYFINNYENKINAKTILIDTNKSFINGIGNTKNTIIHECVHWFYHRNFFYLQHLLDPSISCITCSQVESKTHQEKMRNDLM